ncbi:MAG: SLBB domain-containing protein, partial [Pseudomonadota bacterium]
GKVEMEPGTTLLQAFAEMGGFSSFAATKRVQLRRQDPKTGVETVIPLNYDAMLQGQTANATLELRDGDVIVVPTRRLFE